MAVGDLYQVRIITQLGDQAGLNILHYRVTAQTGPDPTLLSIANNLDGQFRASYVANLSATAQFRGVGVRKFRPVPISPETVSNVGPVNGGVAGDALPRQVSGIITLKTAFAGRAFRGRVYVPFPAESDNTSSFVPTNTYVLNLTLIGNAIRSPGPIVSGPDSLTLALTIFHRRQGTNDLVTSIQSRTMWATQRRRGSYGRPNLIPA